MSECGQNWKIKNYNHTNHQIVTDVMYGSKGICVWIYRAENHIQDHIGHNMTKCATECCFGSPDWIWCICYKEGFWRPVCDLDMLSQPAGRGIPSTRQRRILPSYFISSVIMVIRLKISKIPLRQSLAVFMNYLLHHHRLVLYSCVHICLFTLKGQLHCVGLSPDLGGSPLAAQTDPCPQNP